MRSLIDYYHRDVLFYYIILIGLVGFYAFYFIRKFTKVVTGTNKTNDRSVSLVLLEGFNMAQGTKLTCTVENDFINLNNSDYDIKISMSKITSIIMSHIEVTQKGISFKNAVIGGALFGQIGATMGALKGKDNSKIDTVIISYEDKDGEIQEATLMPDCFIRGAFDIIDAKNQLKYFYTKANEKRNVSKDGKKIIEI